MAMRAKQIGKLADHVERCLRKHPPKKPNINPKPDKWEEELMKLVDADPDLPSYAELQDDDAMLDYLVYYLGEQL